MPTFRRGRGYATPFDISHSFPTVNAVVVQRFCQVKWKANLSVGVADGWLMCSAGATVDGLIGRLRHGSGVLADRVAVHAQLARDGAQG